LKKARAVSGFRKKWCSILKIVRTHFSKFFKKNELKKFTALVANSLALLQKEKGFATLR